MTKVWTTAEEAARLAARFKGVNQAQFARDHSVPGGPSMLSQHIKGRRPLNMDAALAYARGFGVPLGEISPRLAAQGAEAAKANAASEAQQPSPVEPADTTPGALDPIAHTDEERRALISLRRLPAPARAQYVQTVEAAAKEQMEGVRQWIREHLGITRVLTDEEVEEGFRRAGEQMAANQGGDPTYVHERRDPPPAQVQDRRGKGAGKNAGGTP